MGPPGEILGGLSFCLSTDLAERSLFRSGGAVHARGHRESAGGAVGHLDRILPRQAILAGGQILHVRVGTILGAALHRDIAAMAELIDVVLDPPAGARLIT